MKEITGYLIDRVTGNGMSGKTVSFNNLAGIGVTATASGLTTGFKDSVTDANGRFRAWWELSPGPVNVVVDVSASEKKVRKNDEKAQLGWQWSSDISRLSRIVPEGVMRGFLNEMALSFPGGHTIRVGTGAAALNGGMFSIESGPMDLAGTANNNAAINPRLDLVTLRQYNENAAGQDAGRQTIVITEGSASNVVPAVPVGADFKDLPLGVASTAYLGSIKTLNADRRVFGTYGPAQNAEINGVKNYTGTTGPLSNIYANLTDFNVVIAGLDPNRIYDGEVTLSTTMEFANGGTAVQQTSMNLDLPTGFGYKNAPLTNIMIAFMQASPGQIHFNTAGYTWPIEGLTGVTGLTYAPRLNVSVIPAFCVVAFIGGVFTVRLKPR